MNPALTTFNQEFKTFLSFYKEDGKEKKKNGNHSLFGFWTSYENRIDDDVFTKKILEMAKHLQNNKRENPEDIRRQVVDYLLPILHYLTAVHCCYGYYLQKKCGISFQDIFVAENNKFTQTFFPKEMKKDDVQNMLKAVIGFATCLIRYYLEEDCTFQSASCETGVMQALHLIQFSSGVAVKHASFSWIVYNCTILIYGTCRRLMSCGLSRLALNPLVHCTVYMESQVALLTLKYLPWRYQVYMAAIRCLFDLNQDAQAEAFAKRSIEKVKELEEIVELSSKQLSPEDLYTFKQCYLQLNILIFKRNFVEYKRRNKIYRPKFRPLLKDILMNNWPRTGTERLLSDFSGRAAQLLAITEALADTSRANVVRSCPIPESDELLHEGVVELFFAGMEILAGGGGLKPPAPGKHATVLTNVTAGLSSLTLATAESDKVSLHDVVTFVKLAYNYEQWEVFETLYPPVIEQLEQHPENVQCVNDQELLEMLNAMANVNPARVRKKLAAFKVDEQNSKTCKSIFCEDTLDLTRLVEKIIFNESSKDFIVQHHNVLLDVILFIWNICKNNFSKYNSSRDYVRKPIVKDGILVKYFEILVTCQRCMVKLNVQQFHITAFMEATVKICFILQNMCQLQCDQKAAMSKIELATEQAVYLEDIAMVVGVRACVVELYTYCFYTLSNALQVVDDTRDRMLMLNTLGQQQQQQQEKEKKMSKLDDSLYLELLNMHHFIDSLLNSSQNTNSEKSNATLLSKKSQTVKSEENPVYTPEKYEKNNISCALYAMSHTEVNYIAVQASQANLETAYKHLQKAASMERRANTWSAKDDALPPPPFLLDRSSTCAAFRPPENFSNPGVSYYALFLRSAVGNNVKVRLSDKNFPGTGILLPATSMCTFVVRGLQPKAIYVAAVASYDNREKLIAVGHTGRAFVTAPTLPTLQVHAYLAVCAYKCGVYSVSKQSADILWKYFIKSEEVDENEILTNRLNMGAVEKSCVTLQRMFIETVFVSADICIKQNNLYSNNLCDDIPPSNGQNLRLRECRRVIAAMEMATMLNDDAFCLQGCVILFSLLAPLIYWKLVIPSVLQISEYLFALTQEVHVVTRQKKKNKNTNEQLVHMVLSLTYYMAYVLNEMGRQGAAIQTLEQGLKILAPTTPPTSALPLAHAENDTNNLLNNTRDIKKMFILPKKKYTRITTRGILKNLMHTASPQRHAQMKAIEIFLYKLQKQSSDGELTGTEDTTLVGMVLDGMSSSQAYKEVSKFKRRVNFVELYVKVSEKALSERSFDNLLEWTRETNTWLNRRNDILLNKVIDKTAEEKIYAANVVEYKKEKKEDKKTLDVQKTLAPTSLRTITPTKVVVPKKMFLAPDEKNAREALMIMQSALPEMWRMTVRRRKLRSMSNEEAPWRAQMNLDMADCHLRISLDKFALFAKKLGYTNIELNQSVFDPNLLSMASTGSMVVEWAGSIKINSWQVRSLENIPALERSSSTRRRQQNKSRTRSRTNLKGGKESPRRSASANPMKPIEDAKSLFLQNLKQTYIHYQRALVLGHRAGNWVQVQTICSHMLNHTNTMIAHIVAFNTLSTPVPAQQLSAEQTLIPQPPSAVPPNSVLAMFTVSDLRSIIYMPFYTAADFLLEMTDHIGLEAMFEGIEQNNGGSNLSFNVPLDVFDGVDFSMLWKVMFLAIEVLFHERKFERTTSVIMRFNTLTRGYYGECLLPWLVHSQKCVEQLAHINKQPSVRLQPVDIQLEGVSLPTRRSAVKLKKIYKIPFDGLARPSVPVDFNLSLSKFQQALTVKSEAARSIEHARRLLCAYLASKSVPTFPAEVQKSSQSTSTLFSTETEILFENLSEMELLPLYGGDSLVSVVLAYELSIDLLKQTQHQRGLVAQAMHELANIYYHAHDKKNAFKWWSSALTTILHVKVSSWRSLVTDEAGIKKYASLLEKCGIWGCLLAGLIAAKIARYIFEMNVGEYLEMCSLSAACFLALLCGSLHHPSTVEAYTCYRITALLPGISLFADEHRVQCGNLVEHLVWVCARYVACGYYVRVQPLLTLAEYLSTEVCRNLLPALHIRLLRIKTLCALGLYSLAVTEFKSVVSGSDLPRPADILRSKFRLGWPSIPSHNVLAGRNFLAVFSSYSSGPAQMLVYGRTDSLRVDLQHARLLERLASVIQTTPDFSHVIDSTDPPSRKLSYTSEMSLTQKITQEKSIKSFQQASPAQLKAKLLLAAKRILNSVFDNLKLLKYITASDRVSLAVEGHMIFADVDVQCLRNQSAIQNLHLCFETMTSGVETNVRLSEINEATEELHSSDRLNLPTWVQCREKLCRIMLQQRAFTGGALVENVNRGMKECSAINNDFALQRFNFLLVNVLLSEGEGVDQKLKEVAVTLENIKDLSCEGRRLLLEVEMLKIQLSTENGWKSLEDKILDELTYEGFEIPENSEFPKSFAGNNNPLFYMYIFVTIQRLHCEIDEEVKTPSLERVTTLKRILQQITTTLTSMNTLATKYTLLETNLRKYKGLVEQMIYESGEMLVKDCLHTHINLVEVNHRFTDHLSLSLSCLGQIVLALHHKLVVGTPAPSQNFRQAYTLLSWVCVHVSTALSNIKAARSSLKEVEEEQENGEEIENAEDENTDNAIVSTPCCTEDVQPKSVNDVSNYVIKLRKQCSSLKRVMLTEVPLNQSWLKLASTHACLEAISPTYKEQQCYKIPIKEIKDILRQQNKEVTDELCSSMEGLAVQWYTTMENKHRGEVTLLVAYKQEDDHKTSVVKISRDHVMSLHQRIIKIILASTHLAIGTEEVDVEGVGNIARSFMHFCKGGEKKSAEGSLKTSPENISLLEKLLDVEQGVCVPIETSFYKWLLSCVTPS